MPGWIAALLTLTGIGCVSLPVSRFAVKGKRGKAAVLIAHGAAVLLGAVLLIFALLVADNAAGGTADERAWAADAFRLWIRVGGSFTAVVGGVLLAASLIRHKMVKIRALAGCASVLVLLFFGGSYGVICIGESVNPAVWVWLSTAGCAALMNAGGLADAFFSFLPKK